MENGVLLERDKDDTAYIKRSLWIVSGGIWRAYSSDLVPTDYLLFRALGKVLMVKRLQLIFGLETEDGDIFNSKPAEINTKSNYT